LMLRFWQRTPSGEIALRDLLFQGCVPPEYRSLCRFRNSRDLLKAILYGLAAHCDGLRFDPNVFVHAAIDPRTWLPMPRPLREAKERTAAFVAVIFLWVFGWIGMLIIFTDGLSSHAFVFSFLILTIIVTGIPVGSKFDRWSNAQWKRRHPYLADTIIFTREAKDRREGKTSEGEL
ncbi:MAG: hypothetical protein LBG66_06395, partial [Gallionellaceae bacterium]|nr:hypothetical protein [Gallionellaceae bacterium]